jgi:hypothetical protein
MADKPTPVRSISDLFTRLGGATEISRVLCLPMKTVAAWKTRDLIPAEHWPGLVKMAAKQCDPPALVTIESLHTLCYGKG